MKTLFLLLVTSALFSETLYEPKLSQENRNAMKNEQIKCRRVCDKKVYQEQKIDDAVSFYKNSKIYKFNKSGFNSFE